MRPCCDSADAVNLTCGRRSGLSEKRAGVCIVARELRAMPMVIPVMTGAEQCALRPRPPACEHSMVRAGLREGGNSKASRRRTPDACYVSRPS
jgi:hypothetical protein